MSTRDNARTHARRLERLGSAALVGLVAGAALALTTGVGPASAETTGSQTTTFDLGDLDATGTGTFDQFDPSLGTLTAVHITADVTMDFDVCTTNLSDEASSVPAGEVQGSAPVTFAGGVVADAGGALALPGVTLTANAGGDPCQAWLDTGTAPSTGDSSLVSGSDTDHFDRTLTDPAALAAYVGTGTVDYGFTASSDSAISQPSEWTIVFLAEGSGRASVVYEYTPRTTSPSPTPTPTTSPTPSSSHSASPTHGTSPSHTSTSTPTPGTSPGTLPSTGGPPAGLLGLGAALAGGGGLMALLGLRRRKGAHS